MTLSLEDRIRASLDALASRTTIDEQPQFGDHVISSRRDDHHRGTAMRWSVAVAAIVSLVGGVVVINERRSQPSSGSLAVDSTPSPLGLFPTGDAEAVAAAGYATPEAVADAYLADRTRPTLLPEGYTVSYTIGAIVAQLNANEAVMSFSLATTGDSSDGLLLARQVSRGREPKRWVAAGAGIGSLTIDELDYHDGLLRGAYTTGAGQGGHAAVVDVYDALTGVRLASTTGSPFTFAGLGATPLAVRVWQTDGGGYPLAVFGEALVRPDETLRGQGFEAMSALAAKALAAQGDAGSQTTPPGAEPTTGESATPSATARGQGTSLSCSPTGGTPGVGTLYLGGPAWDQNAAAKGFIYSLPQGPGAVAVAAKAIALPIIGDDCDVVGEATATANVFNVSVAPPSVPTPLVFTVKVAARDGIIGVTDIRGSTTFTVSQTAGTPALKLLAGMPESAQRVGVRFKKGDDVWELTAPTQLDTDIPLSVPSGETDRFPTAPVDWVLFTVVDAGGRVAAAGGTAL